MFIHVRDEAGAILAQGDRPPSTPTQQWVPDQVIEETILLHPPGQAASVAVGLYHAATGARLPLFDSQGIPLPDDQYIIPIQESDQQD